MDTKVNDGKILAFLNSTGSSIAANIVVIIGTLIAVTRVIIEDTKSGSVAITGRHRLPKIAAVAFTQGEKLFWDNVSDPKQLTKVSAGNIYAGICAEDAGSSDTEADVLLNKHMDLVNNLSSATAPGVGNDDSEGYSVGSNWFDTTADDAYICLDASTGAAVWKKTTP